MCHSIQLIGYVTRFEMRQWVINFNGIDTSGHGIVSIGGFVKVSQQFVANCAEVRNAHQLLLRAILLRLNLHDKSALYY